MSDDDVTDDQMLFFEDVAKAINESQAGLDAALALLREIVAAHADCSGAWGPIGRAASLLAAYPEDQS